MVTYKPKEFHGAKANGEVWPEYRVWSTMIQRCTNPKNEKYALYGGRGIKVCDRWRSFSAFIEDMGRRTSSDYSIERNDTNGNYDPSNCRWATYTEQNRNRTNNRQITCDGITLSVAAWAEKIGVSQGFLNNRLHRGWTHERTIKEPSNRT